MSLHTDEQFLAAVAAALGETIAFVRRRGFHLEHTSSDDGQRPVRSSVRRRANDDHAIGVFITHEVHLNDNMHSQWCRRRRYDEAPS